MNTRRIRGEATVIILVVLGAVALLGGGLALPSFLQKKPPTAQLEKANQDLATARAAQATAEAQLATVRATEEAKKREQLAYAQQTASGAQEALARVPVAHKTPEVQLASDLLGRTTLGLAAAVGDLPADKRAEIFRIVDGALSSKQAEVDAARAALAVKDAELKVATTERQKLAEQVPVLEAAVRTRDAEVLAKEVVVQTKTQEVVTYANKAAEERSRAGSLDAYSGKLVRILIGIGLAYLFLHYILPCLAQEFPGSRVLTAINKTVKSVTSAHL